MATIDLTSDAAKSGIDGGITVVNVVDFAKNNAAASDVVQIAKVIPGYLVTDVYTVVLTAEGGTATADLGDGVDPNGFNDAINFNATAGTVARTAVGTDAYSVGRYYSAEDTIDYTLDNALDAAKILTVIKMAQYDLEDQKS